MIYIFPFQTKDGKIFISMRLQFADAVRGKIRRDFRDTITSCTVLTQPFRNRNDCHCRYFNRSDYLPCDLGKETAEKDG